MLAMLAPLQLFIGDQHGLNTLKHQPIKIAAMEGTGTAASRARWCCSPGPTKRPRPIASRSRSRRRGSLILTHDPNGLFPGLKSVPPADRPPVLPAFFAFRIMVGIGLLMIAAGWSAPGCGGAAAVRQPLVLAAGGVELVARLRRGDLRLDRHRERPPALARLRHMRTADAISPVPAARIATTLVLFVVVYGIVFAMGIYYINRLINRGPQGARRTARVRHAGPAAVGRPMPAGNPVAATGGIVRSHDLIRKVCNFRDHA